MASGKAQTVALASSKAWPVIAGQAGNNRQVLAGVQRVHVAGGHPSDSLVSVYKVTNVDECLGVTLDQVVNSHGAVGGEAQICEHADPVLREAGADWLKGPEIEGWALVAVAITDLHTVRFESTAKVPANCMPEYWKISRCCKTAPGAQGRAGRPLD